MSRAEGPAVPEIGAEEHKEIYEHPHEQPRKHSIKTR